jgi:hypothetical protein
MTNSKAKNFHLSEGVIFQFFNTRTKKRWKRHKIKKMPFTKQSCISSTNPKHEAWQFSKFLSKSLDPILDILIKILIDTSHLHKQVNQKSRRSFYMLLVCSH